MLRLRTRLVNFYRKRPLLCALLLAVGVLALATRGGFLAPTYHGMILAAQLVDSRSEESALADQNARLQEVYEFLRTPEGQELAARAEVMALKPGERLIVLSEAARQAKQRSRTISDVVQDHLQRLGDLVVMRLRRAKQVFLVWAGVETVGAPGVLAGSREASGVNPPQPEQQPQTTPPTPTSGAP